MVSDNPCPASFARVRRVGVSRVATTSFGRDAAVVGTFASAPSGGGTEPTATDAADGQKRRADGCHSAEESKRRALDGAATEHGAGSREFHVARLCHSHSDDAAAGQPDRLDGCTCPGGCAAVRQNDPFGLHFRCDGCGNAVSTRRCSECRELTMASRGCVGCARLEAALFPEEAEELYNNTTSAAIPRRLRVL